MVLNTQRQVDVLEQESDVTQTIDDFNVMQSPYIFNLWDYRDPTSLKDCSVSAPNWVLGNNKITATHGTDMELLVVSYPPITPLEHKLITNVEIITDILITGEGDTSPIFNSVSLGDGEYFYASHSSTEREVVSGKAVTESVYGAVFTETLWGYSQKGIVNLFQSGNLAIQFNIDLSSNQKTITLQNTKVRVTFDHFFESESLAVENRLGLLGYSLGEKGVDYSLYIDKDGYLIEEYTGVSSPVFTIEFDNGIGNLYVEGSNLPDFHLDANGNLFYGSVEDGSIYVYMNNIDRNDGTYHIGDNITLTVAFRNNVDGRVPNRELLLYIDSNQIIPVTTDDDGYYSTTVSFNTSGNHTVTVINIADNSYNFASASETIEVT